MVNCPNCNRNYGDEFKLCKYCGKEKTELKLCTKCKLKPSVEFSFCPECGTQLVSKSQWGELKRKEVNKLNEQRKEYEKLGQYQKTLECYDKLIELEPQNSSYWRDEREEYKKRRLKHVRSMDGKWRWR